MCLAAVCAASFCVPIARKITTFSLALATMWATMTTTTQFSLVHRTMRMSIATFYVVVHTHTLSLVLCVEWSLHSSSRICTTQTHRSPECFACLYRRSIFYYDKSWMLEANYIQWKFNDTEKKIFSLTLSASEAYTITLCGKSKKERNVQGIFLQMASFTYQIRRNNFFMCIYM